MGSIRPVSTGTARAAPVIADYGVIGDGRSAALVSREGSIDWCCLPDFDSEACFCRILDPEKGGYWRVHPATDFQARRRYLSDTVVLEHTYETAASAVRVTEFMPPTGEAVRLVRLIEGISGTTPLELTCRPTLRYAAGPTPLSAIDRHTVRFGEEASSFVLGATFDLEIEEDRLVGRVQVRAGEQAFTWLSAEGGRPLTREAAHQALHDTLRHWRTWIGQIRYQGPYSTQVRRSALTLKLLTYERTGAVVAAPTTSLPERLGGDLNWDYRYAWLRDAALTLQVLQKLGHHQESEQFFRWLRRIGSSQSLQPVYTIRGERELPERELDHLRGYRDSRPVRIGNAAAGQSQLDTAGHMLDAAQQCFMMMPRPMNPDLWQCLAAAADRVADQWRDTDASIWETRLDRRHFLHSKVLAWVALDRAIALSERLSLAGPTTRWRSERDTLRRVILDDGYNPKVGAFTGVIGTDGLDASALMIPTLGFLPANDPRMLSTTQRIREVLGSNGLVRRNARLSTGEGEGAFLICSFWLTDNLVLTGQIDEGRRIFERAIGRANDLGLLAEEAALDSNELLGNFPQGLSHLGLIQSALLLERGPAQTSRVNGQ
jgi:alpha,alpha-trehalase